MTTLKILILLLAAIGALLSIVIARLWVANSHEERRLEEATRRLGRVMSVHAKLTFL